MLRIENLVFDAWGRRFFDGASVAIPVGAKVGLVGRNGVGKSTLFRLITGQLAALGGEIILPETRSHWIGRSGASGNAGDADRYDSRGRHAARNAQCRTGDGRARGACRNLSALERHRCRSRAREGRGNFKRPWLLQRRSRASDGGIFRRLAHARGAGRGLVRRARCPLARRADQLPRSRGRAVARSAAAKISEHRAHHQSRSRTPQQFRRQPFCI